MSLNYACEKFSTAVDILVSSPDSLQKRLWRAFTNQICFISMHADQLPAHIREEYETLMKRVTWASIDEIDDGQIGASLRRTSEDDLRQLARDIRSFSDWLDEEREKERQRVKRQQAASSRQHKK